MHGCGVLESRVVGAISGCGYCTARHCTALTQVVVPNCGYSDIQGIEYIWHVLSLCDGGNCVRWKCVQVLAEAISP